MILRRDPDRAPRAHGRTRTSVALASLATLALVATGCSADGDTGPTVDATTSPLDAYMSEVWFGSDVDDAQADVDTDTFYGLIEQCMKDEGFTWTRPAQYVPTADSDQPDDPDWVAQWGYGQVTSPYIEWRAETDADGSDQLEGLTQAEQYAYEDALNGTADTYDLPTSQQGCWGAASAEVYGEDVVNLPENRSLMSEVENMQAGRYDDPDLAALDAEWSDCMATAGYDGFEKQVDAEASISDALQAYWYSSTEIVDESPELDAIHDQEVALALADLDCRNEVDYRARWQPIQWAAEQQFIDDHEAELDALLASADAARAAS